MLLLLFVVVGVIILLFVIVVGYCCLLVIVVCYCCLLILLSVEGLGYVLVACMVALRCGGPLRGPVPGPVFLASARAVGSFEVRDLKNSVYLVETLLDLTFFLRPGQISKKSRESLKIKRGTSNSANLLHPRMRRFRENRSEMGV